MFILFLTSFNMVEEQLVLRNQWHSKVFEVDAAYEQVNRLFACNTSVRDEVNTAISKLRIEEVSNFFTGEWGIKEVWLQIQVVRIK